MKIQYKFIIKVFLLINICRYLTLPLLPDTLAMEFVPILLALVIYLISLKINRPIDFSQTEIPDERITTVVDKTSKITLIIMFVVGGVFSVILKINNMIEARGILSMYVMLALGIFIVTSLIVDRRH